MYISPIVIAGADNCPGFVDDLCKYRWASETGTRSYHVVQAEGDIPGGSKKLLERVREFLGALDSLPGHDRESLVVGHSLMPDSHEDPPTYKTRTGHLLRTPKQYHFGSLLQPGHLSSSEWTFLRMVAACYCGGWESRQDLLNRQNAAPLERLRQYLQEERDRMCFQAHREAEQTLSKAVRIIRDERRLRAVARKREILVGGLNLEEIICSELQRIGYSAEVTRRRGDNGIDVLAVRNQVAVAVQVKNHKVPAGPRIVRELRGAREILRRRPDVVALVSANGFTKGAKETARIDPPVLLVSLEQFLSDMDAGKDPFFPSPR